MASENRARSSSGASNASARARAHGSESRGTESRGTESRGAGRELLGAALVALAIFLFVSALSYSLPLRESSETTGAAANWGGAVGFALAHYFLFLFGLASFLFFGFVLYWGLLFVLTRPLRAPGIRVFSAAMLMIVLAVVLGGFEPVAPGPRTPEGLGGSLGGLLASGLQASFGSVGSFLLLLLTGVIAFLIATDWDLRELARELRTLGQGGRSRSSDTSLWRARVSRVARALQRGLQAALQPIAHLFRRSRPVPAFEGGGRSLVPSGPGVEVPPFERPALADPARSAPVPDAEPRDEGRDEAHDAPRDEEFAGEPDEVVEPEPPAADEPEAAPRARRSHRRVPSPRIHRESRRAKPRRRRAPEPLPGGEDYVYPPLELLELAEFGDELASEESLRKRASAIERRLASHKVDAHVVSISAGPAVTVFELEVGEGQRIASLTRFAPDLAAALKAISVRVVAPIPGKHTVGIEVPNENRSFVRLRELIEAQDCQRLTIPLCLGRDVAGKVMVEDLARMPHLLIAGATGSGKSVCINSILLSIMMLKSPAEVRLILIDPKMVELQNYASIPHLMCPVVTNMKKAGGVLAWAVETMERRYALLSALGVRKLQDYNELGEEKIKQKLGQRFDPEETPAHLPSIVLVIDEFADLMAVAAQEVEVSIQRLAQKSRAVGIHVILATQRPSRDVITGLIKANLPTRIAFQVSNRIDSRVILDANGADQLLGHGDMLYIPPGTNRLVRAQGSFVSDEEIHGVVEFLEQQVGRQVFEETLVQTQSGSKRSARDRDELFDKAVRIVLEEQRGSATLLQRKLSVGYTRASRLIELMEEEGVVGLHKGSKSREVMLTLEEWEAMHGPPEPEAEQGELFAEPNQFEPEPVEDSDASDEDGAPWEEDGEHEEDAEDRADDAESESWDEGEPEGSEDEAEDEDWDEEDASSDDEYEYEYEEVEYEELEDTEGEDTEGEDTEGEDTEGEDPECEDPECEDTADEDGSRQ